MQAGVDELTVKTTETCGAEVRTLLVFSMCFAPQTQLIFLPEGMGLVLPFLPWYLFRDELNTH